MKVIRFIYNIFSAILIIAIILITLLALLLGISGIDKDNPKSILGFRSFIVLSPSMTPTFDAGSLIIIKETSPDKLRVDDIITYRPSRSDDVLLTHRIVSIDGEGENRTVITRGDANNIDDNPVSTGAILGKAIFYMDGLGTFIINLRTPFGILSMIGAIAVGLFIIPFLLTLPDSGKKKILDIDSDDDKTEDIDSTEDDGLFSDEDNIDTERDEIQKLDKSDDDKDEF